ncbi:MAG: flavodoxin [Candidatus Lokiarchaeota archaeon]|nr:flavodoxin [Candidatus Lokiarchaeota archaeon]
MTKYLVTYYSRSGATRIAAEAIAQRLGADIDEIKAKKYDAGIMGILTAGIDILMKTRAEIEPATKEPSSYDHVIIGTPVWGLTASNPVISYLEQHKGQFKAVSFFSCSFMMGGVYAFDTMKNACGMSPVATLDLGETEVRQGNYERHLGQFLMQLRSRANVSAPVK